MREYGVCCCLLLLFAAAAAAAVVVVVFKVRGGAGECGFNGAGLRLLFLHLFLPCWKKWGRKNCCIPSFFPTAVT